MRRDDLGQDNVGVAADTCPLCGSVTVKDTVDAICTVAGGFDNVTTSIAVTVTDVGITTCITDDDTVADDGDTIAAATDTIDVNIGSASHDDGTVANIDDGVTEYPCTDTCTVADNFGVVSPSEVPPLFSPIHTLSADEDTISADDSDIGEGISVQSIHFPA